MPFQKGTVPPRLKGKGIPQKYIDIFIAAFNSALKQYGGDEGKAYRIGYAAMNKALRKDGYRKVDGTWRKESDDMPEDKTLLVEAYRPSIEAIEEKDGKLFFEGVALVDNVLSHNKRFYSREFNDAALETTNAWMGEGNVVTIYSRHSKATGGIFGGEGIPIGRLDGKLWRHENTVRYRGMISPTHEGLDMQVLVRDGVVKPTSIRTTTYTAKPVEMEGETVDWLVSGRIEGIDFCERPGIEGAGVKRIYEEAPPYAEPQGEEEPTMEWDALTYEELLEHRPDLLNRYAVERIGPLIQERDAAQALAEELEHKEPEPPDTSAFEEEIAALKRDLAIERAAHGYASRLVAERLRAEDVAEDALEERARAIFNDLLNEAVSETGGGKGLREVPAAEEEDEDAVAEALEEHPDLSGVDIDELISNSLR